MAKPFVKWAGGKGKLLATLEQNLPSDFAEQANITYVEPFVGGGAMLFHMLASHPNITRAVINDINPELVLCYRLIKEEPDQLITQLRELELDFFANDTIEGRNAHFYAMRDEYNYAHLHHEQGNLFAEVERAALFIYLNRTCFNGLYRENNKGEFNVPVGKYGRPSICNEELIREVHGALKHVELLCGDYRHVISQIHSDEYTFVYLDPPYRPLLGSSNFKDYSSSEFGDQQQEELHAFCNQLNDAGIYFMLSNSDSEIEPGLNYFEQLYQGYDFQKVYAPRVINAFAAKRLPQSEVLIRNYHENK